MDKQLLSKPLCRHSIWTTLQRASHALCLLLLVHAAAFAQTSADETLISGEVKDEKSSTIPGASIVLQGTTKGTTTDANGKFSLSVPKSGSVIIVSFLGYKRQEIAVGNRTTFDIQMELSTDELQEVVVVGYGTQRKQTLTGAISNIVSDQIKTTTHTLHRVCREK